MESSGQSLSTRTVGVSGIKPKSEIHNPAQAAMGGLKQTRHTGEIPAGTQFLRSKLNEAEKKAQQ